MDRRGFLVAGLATALTGSRALARMKTNDMSNMDSMPGMDMGDMSNQHAPALTEGEALRELQPLANKASGPGLFKARLVAEPATVRFVEGQDTRILAYNGTSPGPLIEAFEGNEQVFRREWNETVERKLN